MTTPGTTTTCPVRLYHAHEGGAVACIIPPGTVAGWACPYATQHEAGDASPLFVAATLEYTLQLLAGLPQEEFRRALGDGL